MRKTTSIIGLIFLGISCGSATATALEILMRFLVPVFLAQNFAAICVTSDPNFLSDLKDGGHAVDIFADHVKFEITANLTQEEARSVVLAAANNARHVAREELRRLIPEYPALPADKLDPWCKAEAKSYILAVTKKHFDEHDQFLKIIEYAKR
jgi:hypothetical protein